LLADVLERIAEGGLHPPRPITVGLDEAGAVLRRYAERRVIGKYVLIP
jgi:NADPH2:quinone reductase